MCCSKLEALEALHRKSTIDQRHGTIAGNAEIEADQDDEEKEIESSNIEKEYLCTIRTKSYEAIRTEVQKQKQPSFSSTRLLRLLQPTQDLALHSLLHSSPSSARRRRRRFRPILLAYFDFTFRACIFCCDLIHSIGLARASHLLLSDSLLHLNHQNRRRRRHDLLLAELRSHFYTVSNLQSFSKPFFIPSVARRVMSAHQEAARRAKLARHAAKAIHRVDCCGLTAILAENLFDASREQEVVQLETAARGAFALERDLDTMGCMVTRLRDEIEHGRRLIGLFAGEMEDDRVVLREVVAELQATEERFMDGLVELEDHVYLCFRNINRTRIKVVKENLADDDHR